MPAKSPVIFLLIIGLGLLIASVGADSLGIGDDIGFGRQQTMGTIAGVLITAIGLYYAFGRK